MPCNENCVESIEPLNLTLSQLEMSFSHYKSKVWEIHFAQCICKLQIWDTGNWCYDSICLTLFYAIKKQTNQIKHTTINGNMKQTRHLSMSVPKLTRTPKNKKSILRWDLNVWGDDLIIMDKCCFHLRPWNS